MLVVLVERCFSSLAIQARMLTLLQGMGHCYRLYTEESFQKMAISAQPEILRCSLASSYLDLKCIGQDLAEIDLMDKPDPEKCMRLMAS